jgi:Dyp-type peroxidase family
MTVLPEERLSRGILTNPVIRNPDANGYLISVVLSDQLDGPGVQAWLTAITALVGTLESTIVDGERVASVNVAVSASFFTGPNGPRFGLAAGQIPAELAAPPSISALSGVAPASGDVIFYVMSLSEAAVAAFEQGLSATRTSGLASVSVEQGFQRANGRENFGFRDGLRNIPVGERPGVVYLDPALSPDEPPWTAGGSYMAYMKIAQNTEAMAAKTQPEQEQIIGRRKSDGSRIDLPEGTPIVEEGPFTGTTCPVTAHIRKAGPRGTLHDETRIFRRGIPYLELNGDGSVNAGLQFISYQRSLEEFSVIFGRWIENANFPEPDAGTDALLSVITIEKTGFFFSVPNDQRFIGAPIFDPPPPDPCSIGIIVVQKQLLDANNQPILSELGGISFQVLQTGQPVGPQFTTDSTGRAISPPVPRNQALVVREVSPPQGFQQASDTEITITAASTLLTVVDHATPEGPGPIYTG